MARRYARMVLVIGGLTAIATSAAEPYTRQAEKAVIDLEAGDVVHFTVIASEEAHRNAEGFTVSVERVAQRPGLVRVVPDDERFEPLTTGFYRVCAACSDAQDDSGPADDDGGPADDDGGSQQLDAAVPPPMFARYEASFEIEHMHCPDEGECAFGLSVEVLPNAPPEVNTPANLVVSARLERAADGQFFCPADRDFPDGATVRVVAR